MPLTALIEQYLAGPAALRQAVAGLTHEQATARPVEGKWSTLEVVAHIADFELILATRIMRVLSHERPLLLTADENLFAATLNYQGRDLEEELTLVESVRKRTARILRGAGPDAKDRLGIHTFKGLVSLDAILASAVNHIPHHLPFIADKRAALGV